MRCLREDAVTIWQAAVRAADPLALCQSHVSAADSPPNRILHSGGRILVLGGGKAGAVMAAGVEAGLADRLDSLSGIVSVPAGSTQVLQRIELRKVRPAGSNQPTQAGVDAVEEQLKLLETIGAGDLVLCLLSGGGSAILPAPVDGVSLADKQEVTKLLHGCGATIDEMNAVRKHLSRVKGGRLAQQILQRGATVLSLILSDVVGDPLDVIASGPTAADPTTFAEALAILERFTLLDRIPSSVRDHLNQGAAGAIDETPKSLPAGVQNVVIASNSGSLAASAKKAETLGYKVLNLGSYLEGETCHVATTLAGIFRSIREKGVPLSPPVCILSGGETTVTLSDKSGKGGRNQEFVLACLLRLGESRLADAIILSAGTDGEDGPTDAAGAMGDRETLEKARALGLNPASYLERHDAYPLFDATGALFRTGLTQTNVMDVRVMLLV